MAAEIKQARGLESRIVRGSGGEFEVTLDGTLIFSKRAEGRFPALEEVLAKIPA